MSEENARSGLHRKKRTYVKQTLLPNTELQAALRIARALEEQFAGTPTRPLLVAQAIGVKPTSGGWRSLCSASAAYGLTEGGYNAQNIALTELGRRAVAPAKEAMRKAALRDAALRPQMLREFLSKYSGSKLPRAEIGRSILEAMGCPQSECERALTLVIQNAEFVGILREIRGERFVDLGPPSSTDILAIDPDGNGDAVAPVAELDSNEAVTGAFCGDGESRTDAARLPNAAEAPNDRVFISHGANKAVVEQLKRIVRLGRLTPVVAEDEQTPSKPVPQKVFDEMSGCHAGVIHVENEEFLADKQGKERPVLNPNVLIEIGAAMALFKGRYVLLVERGVVLPSNLQGLYRCEYEGDKLDADATIRLLETLREFDQNGGSASI